MAKFFGEKFHQLRLVVTTLLIGSIALFGFSPASAITAPPPPTLTSASTITTGGTQSVRLNFTPGDGTTLAGFKYSTDNGATWHECDVNGRCAWTSPNNYVVLEKLSSGTSSMSNGATVNLLLKSCASGSGNSGGTGLTDCSVSSSNLLSYVVGSVAAPTIATSTTIANGASNPSVTVTGSDFKSGAATSDFTLGLGTTGLTAGSLTFNDTTSVTIAFSGTAKYGSLTIQAKTSAYTTTPGAASNTLTINVPNVVPPAPGTPTGTVISSAQINLSWSAPSNNLGSAVTDYLVYYSSNSGSTWDTFTASVSTATTRNITGLTNSTAYIFKVAAKNSVGYGPFSSNSSAYTTFAGATVPETPTAVSAGSATATSLSVSWTAPTNDGGAAIDNYRLQSSTDGTTWTTVSSTASSPFTVSGLTASTNYYFKVAAHNSIGWGPYSDSSTAVSTSSNAPAPAPTPQPDPVYPPVITSLSKLKVCARGQGEFIIKGSGFRDATVTIDGVAITVKGKSDSSINLDLGETTAGLKTITITNSAGSTTAQVEFKMVDKTAFKVFDIPYIYKGGTFDYTFEAFGENTFWITGNMPAGLVLDPATGRVFGIPTEQGKFNFVIHADGLCGNDADVVKLDVDKEIPNAISYRIKFSNPKSKKITGTAQFELKKFLKEIKEISPKEIDPVIYITGGSPDNESDLDSQSSKERRDSLCDIMLTQDLIAQTILGLFDGEEDEIEIFVYWPVVR